MNELLKTLDESVFTPELQSKIQDLYESKIQKVAAEYEAKLQEAETLVEQTEEKLAFIEAKADEYATQIKETYETKATKYAEYVQEHITEKAEAYAEYVKEELTNTLASYLDIVVEEFVEENKVAIDESVQTAKVKAILEGFDSLLVTTGVSLSQIVEAKEDGSQTAELESLKATVNKLVKENSELKSQTVELAKQSAIDALSMDMTLAQKDKFAKLSEMVVYTGNIEDTYKKLQAIAETVSTKPVENQNTITESFVDEEIKQSTKADKFSHKRFF